MYRQLLPAVVLACVGCAQFTMPTSWIPGKVPEETQRNPADRVVAVWQATDGRGLNNMPSRGFGGEILFFARKGEEPVRVNGDVRIYVFDDQGDVSEQSKPIHQFDFNGGSWNAQLVQGSLGPTYQVFIPYTRQGMHEARCSIRIRYTPEVGPAIYSPVIDVRLPGEQRKPKEDVMLSQRTMPKERVETISLDRRRRPAGSTPRQEPGNDDAVVQAVRIERLEQMINDLVAERDGAAGTGTPFTPTAGFSPDEPIRHAEFVPPTDAVEPNQPLRQSDLIRQSSMIRRVGATAPTFGNGRESGVIRPAAHETYPEDLGSHPINFGPEASAPAAGMLPGAGDHPLGDIEDQSAAGADYRSQLPDVTATSDATPLRRFRLTGRPAGNTRATPYLERPNGVVGLRSQPVDPDFEIGGSSWRDGDE